MVNFLKNHQDWVLAACALGFIVGVIAFYLWGIGRIADSTSTSLDIRPPSAASMEINTSGAKRLFDN